MSSTAWRRYRRRRIMIGGVLLAVVLVALLALALNSCGGAENASNSGSTGNDSGAVGGGGEGAGGSPEKSTSESPEEEPPPYAAIEPSSEARPLSETISAEADARAVEMGNAAIGGQDASGAQYGEETTSGGSTSERSVPLGTTLLSGEEDPSNGPLKNNRVVAYYGTPASELMGVLGEAGPQKTMKRLKRQTKAYSEADPERPAIPAIELIATIAQRDPGPEGLYVSKPDLDMIEQYTKLAEENDALIILDVQLGRASVMDEVRLLEDFLKRPNVQLAIDTEYSIDEGQVPGQDLGFVDGAEIQKAVRYLDNLIEEEDTPDKMLMVHEFQQGIVTNKQEIQPTGNVEVALHADGFGTPEDKLAKYGLLVRGEPIQYGGFKVFYSQDTPVMKPEQVLALDPAPAIVTYQ